MPDDAMDNIDCAKVNVEDSIRDFLGGVNQLLASDYSEPAVFGERLMMIKSHIQSLRTDIQDIEDALRKTIIALPDDIFGDE